MNKKELKLPFNAPLNESDTEMQEGNNCGYGFVSISKGFDKRG